MSLVSFFTQFLFYNLLPAVVAGLLTWMIVYAALAIFRIEYAVLRLSLLAAPLAKSLLILFGLGLVLPWPREVFATWHAQALTFRSVLPVVLLWAGLAIGIRRLLLQRARRVAYKNAIPAEKVAPRLVTSMKRVQTAYRRCPAQMVGQGAIACCVNLNLPQPDVLLSREGLGTPTILTSETRPVIIFPMDLVERLTDNELDRALAHEYAHFLLRSWCGVSSTNLRRIVPVNPIAGLVAGMLAREEEKACDDMAVTALGDPAIYADMLLKSYRFAAERSNPMASRLQVLPQLLGVRPMITERIERLLQTPLPQANMGLQSLVTCLLWAGLIFLFQM